MGGGYHGGFGTKTDFYVGKNGKALPGEHKKWIGVSRRDALLKNVKNEKLRKCFDRLEFFTVMDNSNKKSICMAVFRFYPPFLWSKKKITKTLEESFDECRIE